MRIETCCIADLLTRCSPGTSIEIAFMIYPDSGKASHGKIVLLSPVWVVHEGKAYMSTASSRRTGDMVDLINRDRWGGDRQESLSGDYMKKLDPRQFWRCIIGEDLRETKDAVCAEEADVRPGEGWWCHMSSEDEPGSVRQMVDPTSQITEV